MHTFRYFWIVLLVWSAILSLSAQDEPINLRERWGFIASIGTSVIDLDTGFQVVGVGVTIDSTGTIPITGYFQASFGYNGVMDTMAFITFPDQSFECWEPTLQRDLSGRLWNAGKVFGEKADPVVFFGIVHLTVSGLLMIILPFVQGRRLAPAGGRRPEAGAKRAPAHLPLL